MVILFNLLLLGKKEKKVGKKKFMFKKMFQISVKKS